MPAIAVCRIKFVCMWMLCFCTILCLWFSLKIVDFFCNVVADVSWNVCSMLCVSKFFLQPIANEPRQFNTNNLICPIEFGWHDDFDLCMHRHRDILKHSLLWNIHLITWIKQIRFVHFSQNFIQLLDQFPTIFDDNGELTALPIVYCCV